MRNHFSSILILTLIISSLFVVPLASAGSATWKASPSSGDWNTPANWTPSTVPNGPSDTAFFAASNNKAITLSADIEVNTIEFDSGASNFTITVPLQTLVLSGFGINNSSSMLHDFVADSGGEIDFTNSATINSSSISISNNGGVATAIRGGESVFLDSSSAGLATITNKGGPFNGTGYGGSTAFRDNATANDAIVTNSAGAAFYGNGGVTTFSGHSTADFALVVNKTGSSVYSGTASFAGQARAGNAHFTNEGGDSSSLSYAMITFSDEATADRGYFENGGSIGELGYPGIIEFYGSATAGKATLVNNGSQGGDALGGVVSFNNHASAGNSLIINGGGLVFAGAGGEVGFNGTSTAARSSLLANDAANPQAGGGSIYFFDDSTGDAANVTLLGIGTLDISYHNPPGVTIGSLEDDGIVSLGSNELGIGTNNLDRTFSGLIHDDPSGSGGSIVKIGSSKLTLSSANTYRGGTTVNEGTLLVTNKTGSATGRGQVHVNAGTFGGTGRVAGAVTLGTGSGAGAFLLPGRNSISPGRLSINGLLTFAADSTYQCTLDRAAMKATQVTAGGVTIKGAQFVFTDLGTGALTPGEVFVVVNNASASPIDGEFANLADGSTFTSSGGTIFRVSYEGGTGNDLTLTVQ